MNTISLSSIESIKEHSNELKNNSPTTILLNGRSYTATTLENGEIGVSRDYSGRLSNLLRPLTAIYDFFARGFTTETRANTLENFIKQAGLNQGNLGNDSPIDRQNSVDDFEMLDNIDDKDRLLMDQQTKVRKEINKTGRLEPSNISLAIKGELGEALCQGCNIGIINGQESTLANLDNTINRIKDANSHNNTLLIPIGLTERPLRPTGHAVLGVVQGEKTYIIDPKTNVFESSDYKGTTITPLCTNFQGLTDGTNCGRYTAFTAIELAQTLELKPDTDISEFVKEMQKTPPDLNKIQDEYKDYML
ncbi:hypothetical protein [Vibrio hepatarius]|uniref:hypothetical protein n=1 Tax=Vibrio hepatarius TaxID=171383 RepID=UPI001C0982E9|nr:hypothetical protein [Vibrio hepatarius]MBU2898149.1 hypothetical protein [Vibrio hepatarius]